MARHQLRLSIVNFITIIACEIRKEINTHGKAIISGYIRTDDEETLIYGLGENTFGKLEWEDEMGKTEVLFAGLVESIQIEDIGGVKKATIVLTGGTRLLEGEEHTRTFQNQALTYHQVLKTVEQVYQGAMHIMTAGEDASIGDMIVQYKETDWDFLKRLASHFETAIIPYFKDTGIKYYFGLPVGKVREVGDIISYSIKNNIDEWQKKQKNGVKDMIRQDACSFLIKSREVYDLGEGVLFRGHSLYVYSVQSDWASGELLHCYELKFLGGFRLPKVYNNRMIGASLDAVILAVSGDQVKVQVNVDGVQDKGSAKWFPYSTVYSSSDGSGWYCMPEINDSVRLYFPNEKEAEGYIISSIHQDTGGTSQGGNPTPRSNPDNKSISTKYNKQIELTPSSIIMTNHKGMSVILDDEEGISIISDKDILIQSEEGLTIKSQNESMMVEAVESIELIQGGTTVTLKDDVTVKGAMFKVE